MIWISTISSSRPRKTTPNELIKNFLVIVLGVAVIGDNIVGIENCARVDCGPCSAFYEDMFILRGWRIEEINGIEFEQNSMVVEKWEGKPYRIVVLRQRRTNNTQEIWEGKYRGRFMNFNSCVNWGNKMFDCFDNLPKEMQDAYSFVLDYKDLLIELKFAVDAVEYIETICKTEGFNPANCKRCKNISRST